MAARLKLQDRHPKTGRFVKQRTNGNTQRGGAQIATPIGISSQLTQILRPQAAFRWLLPPVAAITPQYLEMLLRGALAGNHVQQWELFDLMFDTWPTLGQCFQELVHGVQSKKLVFEAHHDEDEKPTTEAVEKTKFVSAALRSMAPSADRDENALDGTIKDILDAWVRGITVLEVLWQNVHDDTLGDMMAPKSTFWVHPVAYGFSQDGILGLRSVSPYQPSGYANRTIGNLPAPQPFPSSYLQATPQPAVLETFPANKFLIAVHKAKSGTALGGPMLRPLAWWWLAANFSADWLLNLAQLFGLPFRFATYDPNAPDDTIQKIFTMLQNMGTAGWAAFPHGTTMDFKEVGGGRQAEYSPQGTLLDRADRYARELILGQTMTGSTMTSGKGGQAFGEVEQDVKGQRIDAAGKFACEIINKQLIPAIIALNYGEGDVEDMPHIRLLEENEGEYTDAQRDQILKSIGLPMGVDFMRKKYGIPEPAEGEQTLDELESQQQATREQALSPVGEDGLPNKKQPKDPQGKNLDPAATDKGTEDSMPSSNLEPAQSKSGAIKAAEDTSHPKILGHVITKPFAGYPATKHNVIHVGRVQRPDGTPSQKLYVTDEYNKPGVRQLVPESMVHKYVEGESKEFAESDGHWVTFGGRHVYIKFSNASGKRFSVHQQEDGSYLVHDNHHGEHVEQANRYHEGRSPATFYHKDEAEEMSNHLNSVHQARLNRIEKLGAKFSTNDDGDEIEGADLGGHWITIGGEHVFIREPIEPGGVTEYPGSYSINDATERRENKIARAKAHGHKKFLEEKGYTGSKVTRRDAVVTVPGRGIIVHSTWRVHHGQPPLVVNK